MTDWEDERTRYLAANYRRALVAARRRAKDADKYLADATRAFAKKNKSLEAQAAAMREVLHGCSDLISSACPDAMLWDEEGGLADKVDQVLYSDDAGREMLERLRRAEESAKAEGNSVLAANYRRALVAARRRAQMEERNAKAGVMIQQRLESQAAAMREALAEERAAFLTQRNRAEEERDEMLERLRRAEESAKAHAPADLAYLLAEVERLKAEVSQMQSEIVRHENASKYGWVYDDD